MLRFAEVVTMQSTTDALKRAGWLLVLPLLAWLALWIPDLHGLVQTVFLAVFLAGAVGAIALPDHRLRNGTVAGLVAFLVGVALAVLVGWLLGHTPGPGETYGSVLAELPVWLLITLPIAAGVAFLGAGLMVLWRRRGLTGGTDWQTGDSVPRFFAALRSNWDRDARSCRSLGGWQTVS